MVREIKENELDQLLELYLHLHETNIIASDKLKDVWTNIVNDPNYHIIVNVIDNIIVSSVTCIIIPNLTRNYRSYALIENVVTNECFRNKGYASECIQYAKEIAIDNDCYKIMLLTGSKDANVHKFYENNGFNSIDKTGYIMKL